MFTNIVPTMLRIRRHTRRTTARKYRMENLKSKILMSAFRKKATTAPKTMMLLNMTIRGTNESGLIMPSKGKRKFIESPKNMRNATLIPTERSTVSNKLTLFVFSKAIIMKPGKKVKYMNPMTCLAMGMFRMTATVIANWKNRTIAKNSLDLPDLEPNRQKLPVYFESSI